MASWQLTDAAEDAQRIRHVAQGEVVCYGRGFERRSLGVGRKKHT